MNMHVSGVVGKSLISDRVSFFELAASHFEERGGEKFRAADGIEFLRLEDFKATVLGDATVFTTIEELAKSQGLLTNGTFGGLTTAIGMDQHDAHLIGCSCNGEEVSGFEVAERLRARAKALK